MLEEHFRWEVQFEQFYIGKFKKWKQLLFPKDIRGGSSLN